MYGALWVVFNSKKYLIWLQKEKRRLILVASSPRFVQHRARYRRFDFISPLKVCCQSSLRVRTTQAPEDKNTPKILLV